MNPTETAPKSRIEFIYKPEGDLIAETVGRVGSLLTTNLFLLTPKSSFKTISPETVEQLKQTYKDVNLKGNYEVYVNHSPLFRQMKRLFEKERKIHPLVRIPLGIPATLAGWATGQLFRSDLYNPLAETAQIYHPRKAVGMHEIGHAEAADEKKRPTLNFLTTTLPNSMIPFWPGDFAGETKASQYAFKHLAKDEHKEAAKILEPAWGTYLGEVIGATSTAVQIGGALALRPDSPLYSVLGLQFFPLPLFLSPVIGMAAGHIHSRISKNNIFTKP